MHRLHAPMCNSLIIIARNDVSHQSICDLLKLKSQRDAKHKKDELDLSTIVKKTRKYNM